MFAKLNSPIPLVLFAILSIAALSVVGAREFRLASAGPPPPLVVTTNADTNDGTCDADCSLREAIIAANANPGVDTITVPADTYTFTIVGGKEDLAATGDLDITDDLTINGADAATTAIDAATLDRVFHVDPGESGITVNISDLTITGGKPPGNGGGILNSGAVLTVEDSVITGNDAGAGSGASGGGIRNAGASILVVNNTEISDNVVTASTGDGGGVTNDDTAVATINDSVIVRNSASQGGGVHTTHGAATIINNSVIADNEAFNGGGIYQAPPAAGNSIDIANTTISGNSATNTGGGIFKLGDGTINLNNVTVTNNTADSDSADGGDGGGIANAEDSGINLKNTIVAGNFDSTSDPDCLGTLTSQGYNLIEVVSPGCTIGGDTTGNVIGVDPLLMPLSDNGGPSETHAIPAGSAAVDAGNPTNPGSGGDACEAADQRGVSRPLDGDTDTVALCDIGAFEAPGDPPTATPAPTATPVSTPTPSATPSPTTTPTPTANALWGDNDCDIDADAVDGLKGLQHIAAIGFTQNEPCPDLGSDQEITTAGFGLKTWGDVDCDGDVDAVDALNILRFVAALPSLETGPDCPDVGAAIILG